jgi:hypothetical protein
LHSRELCMVVGCAAHSGRCPFRRQAGFHGHARLEAAAQPSEIRQRGDAIRTADAPSPPPRCAGTPSPAPPQCTEACGHGARWYSPPANQPHAERWPQSSQVRLPRTAGRAPTRACTRAMLTHGARECRSGDAVRVSGAHRARRRKQHQRYGRQVTRLLNHPLHPARRLRAALCGARKVALVHRASARCGGRLHGGCATSVRDVSTAHLVQCGVESAILVESLVHIHHCRRCCPHRSHTCRGRRVRAKSRVRVKVRAVQRSVSVCEQWRVVLSMHLSCCSCSSFFNPPQLAWTANSTVS